MCTSAAAYQFALEMAEQYEKTEKEKDDRSKKNQEAAAAVSSNGEKDIAPSSDARRVVSEIDYGKFEALAGSLEKEEKDKQDQLDSALSEERDKKRAAMQCSHDHSRERQIYEKPTEEKIRATERFRGEGNAEFKEKNYGLAAVHYRKALLQFDYTFPDTDEERRWMESVKIACHLNLAACKLHQEEFEEVFVQTRQALLMDPKNVKALHREGVARMAVDDFEKASSVLMAALQIEPANPDTRQAYAQLQQKKRQYSNRNRRVYAAALGADSSSAAPKAGESKASEREGGPGAEGDTALSPSPPLSLSTSASHETATRSASHETATPSASHETATPSASHETATRSASHETATPSAAHETATPPAAHETATPSATHETATRSAAHETATVVERNGGEEADAGDLGPVSPEGRSKKGVAGGDNFGLRRRRRADVPTAGRPDASPNRGEMWSEEPLPNTSEGHSAIEEIEKDERQEEIRKQMEELRQLEQTVAALTGRQQIALMASGALAVIFLLLALLAFFVMR